MRLPGLTFQRLTGRNEADRRVNHFYTYVQDRDWGPAFRKIGTYLPYPVKRCLNGHWVKQRLRRDRIRFESLDNGFLSCADPAALQAACDALGPTEIQACFDRWSHRLPWAMTLADRTAGYDHRLAICQLEMRRTQVFDRPVHGRHFFEAVIRENLDLGGLIASASSFRCGSRAPRRHPPTAIERA